MTSLSQQEQACFVCGARSEHPVLVSTNQPGSPDLDLRPPAMMRSAMAFWIRRCPGCGYCAASLEHGPAIAGSLVGSKAYLAQLNDANLPELARHFLCASLILAAADEGVDAAQAALHAAWVCDDAHAQRQADACRMKAIALFEGARGGGRWLANDTATEALLLADLHRRAGQFGPVAQLCAQGLAADPKEPIHSLLRAQQRLALSQDRRPYTVAQALEHERAQALRGR